MRSLWRKSIMHSKQLTYRALAASLLLSLGVMTAPLLGQSRPSWGTASDIRTGVRGTVIGSITDLDSSRNVVSITADSDRAGTTIRASADSVTTRFYGFGTGTEILKGTVGFGRLRQGDRVQITGTGRPSQAMTAEEVTLLGRPSTGSGTNVDAQRQGTIEGVVRQVNAKENRLVIESGRQMYTVFGTESTPVYYRNETYRIRNIEVGDRLRVQVESTTRDGVRARIIDVLSSVQESGQTNPGSGTGTTLTSVSGRVTRIDTRAETVRLNTNRGEIRVDTRSATDNQGRDFRLTDLQVGDSIEISGRWQGTDAFLADTVRFSPADDRYEPGRNNPVGRNDDDYENNEDGFDTVVLYGTVQEGLQQGERLRIKDSNNKEISVILLDDFVVQLKNGAYVTADQLKKGDRVVVKAFRDDGNRHIAQTVRTR